jgi:hypothetical protein
MPSTPPLPGHARVRRPMSALPPPSFSSLVPKQEPPRIHHLPDAASTERRVVWGLDVSSALRDAAGCRASGSPALHLDLAPLRLRAQGRAAEAWLCSWLLAWLRWVDAVANGPVHARLTMRGAAPRARLCLDFVPQLGTSTTTGHVVDRLPAAPCWQAFLPIGAALHEICTVPAHPGAAGPAPASAPARHRVHLDLGPCLSGPAIDLGIGRRIDL